MFNSKIVIDTPSKRIKSGNLYWFPLDCPDLETFFLRRLFRKFNIVYIPFTLRFYEEIYLREDKSKFSRILINYCKKKGIRTYVVQEGVAKYHKHPTIFLNPQTDIFLCPDGMLEWWIDKGIPRNRIRVYHQQKPREYYKGIVFLHPIYTADDVLHAYYWDGTSAVVMKVIFDFLKKDVVFKPHPKNDDITKRIIPKHRLVSGKAKDLILKYDKIYCFRTSSVRKDCEMLNKKYEVVDK